MTASAQTQRKPAPSPTSTPVRTGVLQRKCACGGAPGPTGECASCRRKRLPGEGKLQAKLTVSEPGDRYERQADRVADAVMSMTAPAPEASVAPQRRVQRQDISSPGVQPRRQDDECEGGVRTAPPIAQDVLRSPGRSLDAATRVFMESRFGHDFSTVRVHADAQAASSAQAVRARAYTMGETIAFGTGQYVPETGAGRRLLAHELTHVVQQRRTADAPRRQVQAAPSGSRAETEPGQRASAETGGGLLPAISAAQGLNLQRQEEEKPEPGTSVHPETVLSTSSEAPGIWSGEVLREALTGEGRRFDSSKVFVRYDESTCRVTLPMTVAFRNPTLADLQRCPPHLNKPAPTKLPNPLSKAASRRFAERFLRVLNEDLNGWYSVRWSQCETNPCYGKNMPIEVEVTEADAAADADYEVVIVNMKGRSCVVRGEMMLLYAQDLSSRALAHEGGHMVLGAADEYREMEDPGPDRPVDRVRAKEWSLMGDRKHFGRFTMLHKRHFDFVPQFLNKIHKGCDARLVEERPPQPDVSIDVGAGYASFAAPGGRTHGFYQGLGLGLGVPLSRQREWKLIFGVHGRWLGELEAKNREAFLLGARLGLEHTMSPSIGGFTVGGFGELGASWLSQSDQWISGRYAEGGGYLGYTMAPKESVVGKTRLSFDLEGAVGATFPGAATIGEPMGPTRIDRRQLRYFRLGLKIGARF